MNNLFLYPWLIAAITAFIATPIIIHFSRILGIIDDPRVNIHPKVIHKVPTPRGGGIIIFIALLTATVIFLPLDKHIIGIMLGALVICIMGYLDDRFNLNPYLRLIIGFIAVALPIASGIGIAIIANPLGGIIDSSQPKIAPILMVSILLAIIRLIAIIWILIH